MFPNVRLGTSLEFPRVGSFSGVVTREGDVQRIGGTSQGSMFPPSSSRTSGSTRPTTYWSDRPPNHLPRPGSGPIACPKPTDAQCEATCAKWGKDNDVENPCVVACYSHRDMFGQCIKRVKCSNCDHDTPDVQGAW
jgi:hypothetical protein